LFGQVIQAPKQLILVEAVADRSDFDRDATAAAGIHSELVEYGNRLRALPHDLVNRLVAGEFCLLLVHSSSYFSQTYPKYTPPICQENAYSHVGDSRFARRL
jgi:hypothetical protein